MRAPPERKRGPALGERSPEKSAFIGTGTQTDKDQKAETQQLFARVAITSERAPEREPERLLPNVAAARERDRLARARLRSGVPIEGEPEPDFATRIRTYELAGKRGRRR